MTALIPLPEAAAHRRPPGSDWERAAASPGVRAAAEALVDPAAHDRLGRTLALVVVQHGRVVHEWYADTVTPTTPLICWSMSKTLVGALAGIAVEEGRLELDATPVLREWAADERSAITLRHLLRMRSGLEFVEDYVDDQVSHCIEMLFGSGADDVAAYAAARPAIHAPDVVWNYSSGETNLIVGILADALGGPEAFRRWATDRLLDPVGMSTYEMRTDAAGTFVGSSFGYASALDDARFGELLLRGGVWGDRRILPSGWVDAMRTPHATDPETGQGYGLQTWTQPDVHGTFGANGYEGQYTRVVPALDAVVVRLGKSPAETHPALRGAVADLIDTLEETA